MVRQWQELFWEKRYSHVDMGNFPDFVKLADAYGIPGWRTDRHDEVAGILQQMREHPGPCLAEFIIDPEANVRPIVPLGSGLPDFVEEIREEGM
jgi:acetolactate synthase-1/2/3 large subunit